ALPDPRAGRAGRCLSDRRGLRGGPRRQHRWTAYPTGDGWTAAPAETRGCTSAPARRRDLHSLGLQRSESVPRIHPALVGPGEPFHGSTRPLAFPYPEEVGAVPEDEPVAGVTEPQRAFPPPGAAGGRGRVF